MDFLKVVPNHYEDPDPLRIFINIIFILIGMVFIIAGSAFADRFNRIPLLGNAVGSIILLLNIFSIFRMIYPGISSFWGLCTIAIPIIILIVPLFTRLEKIIRDNLTYLAAGLASIILPIIIAYAFDKINEQLASIPATWGALIFAILGILAFTSDN